MAFCALVEDSLDEEEEEEECGELLLLLLLVVVENDRSDDDVVVVVVVDVGSIAPQLLLLGWTILSDEINVIRCCCCPLRLVQLLDLWVW